MKEKRSYLIITCFFLILFTGCENNSVLEPADPILKRLLSEDVSVRKQAIIELNASDEISKDAKQSVISDLVGALSSSENEIRWRSAWALGTLVSNENDAIKALGVVAGNPDDSARYAAVEALGKIGERSIPELGRLLQSENDQIKSDALTTLMSLSPQSKEYLFGLVQKQLEDRKKAKGWQPSISNWSSIPVISGCEINLWDVCTVVGERCIPTIMNLYENDNDKIRMEARKYAFQTLQKIGASTIKPHIEALGADNVGLQRHAFEYLKDYGVMARLFLIDAFKESKKEGRGLLAILLGHYGEKSDKVFEVLAKNLDDERMWVVSESLDVISEYQFLPDDSLVKPKLAKVLNLDPRKLSVKVWRVAERITSSGSSDLFKRILDGVADGKSDFSFRDFYKAEEEIPDHIVLTILQKTKSTERGIRFVRRCIDDYPLVFLPHVINALEDERETKMLLKVLSEIFNDFEEMEEKYFRLASIEESEYMPTNDVSLFNKDIQKWNYVIEKAGRLWCRNWRERLENTLQKHRKWNLQNAVKKRLQLTRKLLRVLQNLHSHHDPSVRRWAAIASWRSDRHFYDKKQKQLIREASLQSRDSDLESVAKRVIKSIK